MSNGLEAAQLDDYFLYWAEKKYLGITPSSGTTGAESGGVTTGGTGGNSSSSSEAESQILEDKNFDFVVEIPKDLLIMVIAMGYSIIAPAVMPCAALYFIICWFCFKHQVSSRWLFRCFLRWGLSGGLLDGVSVGLEVGFRLVSGGISGQVLCGNQVEFTWVSCGISDVVSGGFQDRILGENKEV